MKLSDLVKPLIIKHINGDIDIEISGLQMDSRKIVKGDLFIAIAGFTVDGHDFIERAIDQGAAAIVAERPITAPVPTIVVPDSKRAMAVLSATFYQDPTQELNVIGVTGTNGKTTTTYLIEQILRSAHIPTGVIGTIGMKIGNHTYKVNNTTPEVLELQKGFRMMKDEGLDYAVIEVSSHALHLGRTRGLHFRTAVFTNLTQDHLDYHQTMDQYRNAKGLLFSQLDNDYQKQSVAVLNADDDSSEYFARITPAQVVTYGIEQPADVQAKNIQITSQGTHFTLQTFLGTIDMHIHLVGMFNVYNALAAATASLLEGCSLKQIKQGLEQVEGVKGRFELIRTDQMHNQDYMVLVDYAHTPDSLENALSTIREFAKGKVFCVVGCGGDRDQSKRPMMAQVAETYSDQTIITSDNPRSEDPAKIIDDMVQGLTEQDKYVVCIDRKKAIECAINQAKPEDVILIAGKGHETYQEIKGVRYDFDDREIARRAMQQKGALPIDRTNTKMD